MPPPLPQPAMPSDAERALALLRRHGWNATSFQVLEPDFRYWFDGEDALVAYVDTGRGWVAAGAPVAQEERLAQVAARFCEAAARAGRRACFFSVEERFLRATGWPALRLGEQPVWDPAAWGQSVAGSRSLREQLRRARAKGVAVRPAGAEELAPGAPTRAGVEALVARWLGRRPMAPMGFLVQVHPFTFPLERRYFVAEHAGRVVGLLAAVPVFARGGWFFEDLLRDPALAPNGTAELLVDAAMRAVAAEGCRYVTLGMVPLAGPVSGWLRLARRGARGLYDFRGLHAFKARLRPQAWAPLSLAFPPGQHAALALADALAAFARGGLLRFGVETLRRGPALVVQALSLALVPWTALLAALPAERFFPAAWVKWAWVAFDVGLVGALLVLARRWRPWLATGLASVITADAALTLAQVVVFNAGRARGVAEWAGVGVACAAPALAAGLLWSARAHRMRWG